MYKNQEFFFAQASDIIESYGDVLQTGSDRAEAARGMIEILKSQPEKFVAFEDIWKEIQKDHEVVESFCRQTLRMFVSRKIAEESGKGIKVKYRWANPSDEVIATAMEESYGSGEKTPSKVREYHKEYGFISLVEDVSKWIDHEGRVVKEYDLDRLWLGRYVDFLDKARQYTKWFEADQAIAKKKIADIRKNSKGKL